MRKMLSESILDLEKCPNRKRMKVKVHVFRLGHFARSKIESESIFLLKYYIITILKKEFGAFWPIFNKVKTWISHGIFKSCAEGFAFFLLQARKLIFLPNSFYLPPKQP